MKKALQLRGKGKALKARAIDVVNLEKHWRRKWPADKAGRRLILKSSGRDIIKMLYLRRFKERQYLNVLEMSGMRNNKQRR
jgi:hypothetical protein